MIHNRSLWRRNLLGSSKNFESFQHFCNLRFKDYASSSCGKWTIFRVKSCL